MIKISSRGNFNNAESFLKRTFDSDIKRALEAGGQAGVNALRAATPIDSGATAAAWGYSVEVSRGFASITWTNTNLEAGGTPIAIMLQYGHGTGTGGFVTGRDYINPALKPVFDGISDSVWKAVTSK